MILSHFRLAPNSALFLDRDGVINRRIPGDYVRNIGQFEWIDGSLQAIVELSKCFNFVFVVTNQQGIGKGLFTEADLNQIHQNMCSEIIQQGGRIDRIYFCPALASENSKNRKPQAGMAFQAKSDFPEISLKDSLMVGDSVTDLEFARNAGMKAVFIHDKPHELALNYFSSLSVFTQTLLKDLALKS